MTFMALWECVCVVTGLILHLDIYVYVKYNKNFLAQESICVVIYHWKADTPHFTLIYTLQPYIKRLMSNHGVNTFHLFVTEQ